MDSLNRLLEIMRRLRDPAGGCPWDIEQDFASIAPYTIEEAYEVADAIERGDFDDLRDELGDLLLQVVYHAQMASEQGRFDFEAVVASIADKLVRRHPHVFGDAEEHDARSQTESWEAIKAAEREARGEGAAVSALDGVSVGLPGLTRAMKLGRRAARVGFDWDDVAGVLAKVREELAELEVEIGAGAERDRLEDELGDVLFACSSLARYLELDPEAALRRTNAKFERRFRRIEALLAERNLTPAEAGMEMMEAAWQQAKQEERDG